MKTKEQSSALCRNISYHCKILLVLKMHLKMVSQHKSYTLESEFAINYGCRQNADFTTDAEIIM